MGILVAHRLGIPTVEGDQHQRGHLSRASSSVAIRMRVRTLFGAVHGVVHLALQGQLVGVP